jgi:hypothetical protein
MTSFILTIVWVWEDCLNKARIRLTTSAAAVASRMIQSNVALVRSILAGSA